MGYFEEIDKEATKNWIKYMELDGITEYYTLEEFWAEMQKDDNERNRAINLIEAGVPSTITVGNLLQGGMTNYFIISDRCNGVACEKCNSAGAVILLLDKDLKTNFENKIFLPALEYYYVLGIKPKDIELLKNPPIPVNLNTDYWYCPYCNEIHKFSYNKLLGLEYAQEPIKVEIDMNKHLKKHEGLEEMILKQMGLSGMAKYKK